MRRMPEAATDQPAPTTRTKRVDVWTDGSCDTASGHGGWAYLLRYGRHSATASGYEANTTNNRMELTAAVRALEALREPCRVRLVTDSQYLKKAFTDGWLAKWQRNGWRTASKAPVKNRDLWEPLIEAHKAGRFGVPRWVKGHSGDVMNDLVDRLAVQAVPR